MRRLTKNALIAADELLAAVYDLPSVYEEATFGDRNLYEEGIVTEWLYASQEWQRVVNAKFAYQSARAKISRPETDVVK